MWYIPISVKITKIILPLEKFLKSAKKSKAFFKHDEVLGGIMKYWEMLNAFYFISKYQNNPPEVTEAQYHTEAIKSVPVTEKHEKPLIKILKTWKNN